MKDSARHQVLVDDVQLWGPRGAAGGPGSSTGTNTFSQREPGLYSVRIRLRPVGPRWIYAATVRAGFLDTVLVRLVFLARSFVRRNVTDGPNDR